MAGLQLLYNDVVLAHKRRPRNFAVLETANRKEDGYNPLCGDRLTLYLEIEGGVIRNAGFQGSGCAISLASASLLTETIKGKTIAEAEELSALLCEMLALPPAAAVAPNGLGELSALAGVRAFPARLSCATLAGHTLHAALAKNP